MARKNATDTEVLNWIGYWDRSSQGPTFSAVHTVEDMTLCRRYNPVLNTYTTSDRSDAEMFALLQRHRSGLLREAA